VDYIPVANVVTSENDAQTVYDVVKSGWISKGKKVEAFEALFAETVRAEQAVAVNSGTSALHTVLAAMDIGPGDEVILPSLTFISTANVVLYQGATPVLVECEPKTYNVSRANIEKAITSKTKAIIPVDMNGMPIDYDEILKIEDKHGIPIIADSAESLGAIYKDEKVGSIAGIHCFSFFPNKAITTGEGGMITTSNGLLSDKMRKILNQGQDERYHHVVLGYNYRMNDIQAALGIEQIGRLGWIMSEKKRIVESYQKRLSGNREIELPTVPNFVDQHSWYMFAVQVDERIRDDIVKYLDDHQIQTRLSFPPVHIQPYYQKRFGYTNDSFPVSYRTWKRLINLPVWPGLSANQIEYITETLTEAVPKHT
jgi:perosamine synthetase|tara:strand:- start:1063 stop:2169 length:1107 start_codon:yes stop_codon:yes gene_type:complete